MSQAPKLTSRHVRFAMNDAIAEENLALQPYFIDFEHAQTLVDEANKRLVYGYISLERIGERGYEIALSDEFLANNHLADEQLVRANRLMADIAKAAGLRVVLDPKAIPFLNVSKEQEMTIGDQAITDHMIEYNQYEAQSDLFLFKDTAGMPLIVPPLSNFVRKDMEPERFHELHGARQKNEKEVKAAFAEKGKHLHPDVLNNITKEGMILAPCWDDRADMRGERSALDDQLKRVNEAMNLQHIALKTMDVGVGSYIVYAEPIMPETDITPEMAEAFAQERAFTNTYLNHIEDFAGKRLRAVEKLTTPIEYLHSKKDLSEMPVEMQEKLAYIREAFEDKTTSNEVWGTYCANLNRSLQDQVEKSFNDLFTLSGKGVANWSEREELERQIHAFNASTKTNKLVLEQKEDGTLNVSVARKNANNPILKGHLAAAMHENKRAAYMLMRLSEVFDFERVAGPKQSDAALKAQLQSGLYDHNVALFDYNLSHKPKREAPVNQHYARTRPYLHAELAEIEARKNTMPAAAPAQQTPSAQPAKRIGLVDEPARSMGVMDYLKKPSMLTSHASITTQNEANDQEYQGLVGITKLIVSHAGGMFMRSLQKIADFAVPVFRAGSAALSQFNQTETLSNLRADKTQEITHLAVQQQEQSRQNYDSPKL